MFDNCLYAVYFKNVIISLLNYSNYHNLFVSGVAPLLFGGWAHVCGSDEATNRKNKPEIINTPDIDRKTIRHSCTVPCKYNVLMLISKKMHNLHVEKFLFFVYLNDEGGDKIRSCKDAYLCTSTC